MSVTFAASLRKKLKLQNDDKVAIILPNTPEYPCSILGVLQAGCIASMMNPVYTARKYVVGLVNILSSYDARGFVSRLYS